MRRLIVFTSVVFFFTGCYSMRSNQGGAETEFSPPRSVNPSDIAVPSGYRVEAVAQGLTFPTGVAFDKEGTPYVVESGYAYGEVWATPRLMRIEPNGSGTPIVQGMKNGPWTGVDYANGSFYIAEGGELEGGRIFRVPAGGGRTEVLIKDLPSLGDHHTNGPVVGKDGIYFTQGVATNSGVVGTDNYQFGWLKRYPKFHDIPCRDVTLSGENFETDSPFVVGGDKVVTGAYLPYGQVSQAGQVVQGQIPCSGAVMRIPLSGGEPELIAWGLRNPFGLAFHPDGRLFVTENGFDVRGSRPVWGAPDLLWEIQMGRWYGWPDYTAGKPVNDEAFHPPGKQQPRFLLASHPEGPPTPVTEFAVHSSSNGFDFSRNPAFGYSGHAFVAQLGDETPTTGKLLEPAGFKVVRVNVENGNIDDFAVNKGKTNGPASLIGGGGLERPVAARFNPDGTALYIVDFGVMTHQEDKAMPRTGTGVLWRVTREGHGQ